MRRECLITARLAGPCACCRQPAWPAHVWPDGRILCGHCCPCARRDAAPGRDAAGHAHDAGPVMPREAGPGHAALAAHRGPAKNRPRIGLPAGAVASGRGGKGRGTTPRETGPSCAATAPARAAARSMPPEQSGPARGMPEKRATGAYIAPAGRGKARDTAPPVASDSGPFLPLRGASCAAMPPCQAWPRCRPPWPAPPPQAPHNQVPAASRGENNSGAECYGPNFISHWRFYDAV
jgi:hypothetical protein